VSACVSFAKIQCNGNDQGCFFFGNRIHKNYPICVVDAEGKDTSHLYMHFLRDCPLEARPNDEDMRRDVEQWAAKQRQDEDRLIEEEFARNNKKHRA